MTADRTSTRERELHLVRSTFMVQHVTKIEERKYLENNSSWETSSEPKGGPSGTARPKITAPTKKGSPKFLAK